MDNLYKTTVQLKYFFFVLFFVFGRKINCFFGRFYFSAENGKYIFGRSLIIITLEGSTYVVQINRVMDGE